MQARRAVADERGLTLIELMVSFFLLSVILSAVAASLITFTQATSENERRVESTALLNRLHEDLQATPWFDAIMYDQELDELLDPDEGIADQLEGRELVVTEGPVTTGCPSGEPECNRRALAPRPYLLLDRGGIPVEEDEDAYYEVFQAVTWLDGAEQTKRFTTVVRWQMLDRSYEERFESERTATAAEAGDPTLPRVVHFQVGPPSPATISLHPEDVDPQSLRQRNVADIKVVVRFSEGIDTAKLAFYQVQSVATDASQTVQLQEVVEDLDAVPSMVDAAGRHLEWETTLPAGSYRFTDGSRRFRAIGTLLGDDFGGSTTASFSGGGLPATPDPDDEDLGGSDPDPDPEPDEDLPDPPEQPVAITSRSVAPSCVRLNNDDTFRATATVQANVQGLQTGDATVTASYNVNGVPRTVAMRPEDDQAIDPAGTTFRLVLAEGQSHGFDPPSSGPSQHEDTRFEINALRRADGNAPNPEFTGVLRVTRNNC